MDEAVFDRLVQAANAQVGNLYPTRGKPKLLAKLRGYNEAARLSPWLVIIDLDRDADCAPPFLAQHLPSPSPHMICRIAVRAIEAWLLADRERIAQLLRVPVRRVPAKPEELLDPKRSLIDLARRSSSSEIRA
ncbi:MAG: hypothetical protein ACRENS_11135, partial [Candidatus Eiseniibacteriota bacterium]